MDLILLRYFFREVLVSTGAVSVILLMVTLSTRFVKYLASAAAGDLDTNVLFLLILYHIPNFLQLILPLAMFVALLLTYGRLYLDNEMRVLFAAGMSRFHLLLLTMVPVLALALLVALISLWISPRALTKVDALLEAQSARSEIDSLKEGRFLPFQNYQGVIYTEKINNDTPEQSAAMPLALAAHLSNVYIFEQEDVVKEGRHERNDIVLVSNSGKQIANENGRYLILEEGYRVRQLKQEDALERVDFARYGQRIKGREPTETPNLKMDATPTSVLMYSSRNDYQATWQWRLSLVLLVPVVAIIAVGLGKTDPRQGRYLKLLPAILIYLVYLVLLNVARDKLTNGDWPFGLGMWWIHAVFLLFGILIFNIENWRYFVIPRQKTLVTGDQS